MKKIKVGTVNYLNAKPLLAAIQADPVMEQIDLYDEYPAKVALMLADGAIDVGLVPVATLSFIPNTHIIGNYGIAADGNVASVCIYSHQPIEMVDTIYLDYQSKTSVRLAQILLKHYFKQSVQLVPAPEDYIGLIKDNVAGVIIGDRALEQLPNFPYIYDLATEWKNFTGLPFVFAAWIANKPLPESFIKDFDQANSRYESYIDHMVAKTPFPHYDLSIYYRENIHYYLDENKKKGLALFLQYLKEMEKEIVG